MTMYERIVLTAVVMLNNRWTVPRHGGIDVYRLPTHNKGFEII